MRAESAFEKQCIADLQALGYLVYSVPDTRSNRRQRGNSGFPDITFAGRGRVGFIECKMPVNKRGNTKLDNGQVSWRGAILSASNRGSNLWDKLLIYRVATPDNWQEILEGLE